MKEPRIGDKVKVGKSVGILIHTEKTHRTKRAPNGRWYKVKFPNGTKHWLDRDMFKVIQCREKVDHIKKEKWLR